MQENWESRSEPAVTASHDNDRPARRGHEVPARFPSYLNTAVSANSMVVAPYARMAPPPLFSSAHSE